MFEKRQKYSSEDLRLQQDQRVGGPVCVPGVGSVPLTETDRGVRRSEAWLVSAWLTKQKEETKEL